MTDNGDAIIQVINTATSGLRDAGAESGFVIAVKQGKHEDLETFIEHYVGTLSVPTVPHEILMTRLMLATAEVVVKFFDTELFSLALQQVIQRNMEAMSVELAEIKKNREEKEDTDDT